MSKYLDRLNQDKKVADAAAATVAEAQAKALVQQEIAKLTANAATLTAAYNAALGSTPFNVGKVVSLTKEIASNTAGLTTIEGILAAEFTNA